MTNEPEQTPGIYSGDAAPPAAALRFDPATGQPLPTPMPAPLQPQLIAPVWHTVAIVIIILGNSYLSSARLPLAMQNRRILLYAETIVWQLFLLLLVWIGLRLKKTRLRDLIGGRWNSVEDFVLDVAIAGGFWLAAISIIAGLKFAMGLASLKDSQHNVEQVKQTIGALLPATGAELLAFVSLTVFAGIIEEIVFRGYLQRQLGAIARNAYAGLAISAIIFGAGHGYQGVRQMILIAILGAMFGMLVLWRKSLRPAMMAHTWQDAFAGIGYFVLTKLGKI